MSRTPPQERWHKLLLERFAALKQSRELKGLRGQGLTILGRRKMLTAEEWVKSFTKRISIPGYLAWCNGECRELGERFGLASWVVAMVCLVRGYNPEKGGLMIGSDWPRIVVVTENSDQAFINKLACEAQQLGSYVVIRQGASESALVLSGVGIDIPTLASRPPMYTAFHIRVETPIGYPPDAARRLQRQANQLGRELLLRLGYRVPKRLRTSSLTAMASRLEIGKSPLSRGHIYDITDKVYSQTDLSQDQRRRGVIKVRRHRLKKRLGDADGAR